MILFFGQATKKIFAVQTTEKPTPENINKLSWLFGNQAQIEADLAAWAPHVLAG